MRVLTWVCATLAIMCLNGCAFTEPYVQSGTWRPTNAPDANIAAQAVRPSDLVAGVPYAPVSAVRVAAAVDRWKQDKVRDLPQGGISKITFGASGAPQASPADQPAGTAGGAP